VIALLEEVEVAADEPLDVEDVEYEVDTWFALVAEVPMLGAIGDDVGVTRLGENEA
jgi:hypothetical protein